MKKILTPVTVILRGYKYEMVRAVALALENSTIRNMEITLNTENAYEIITKIVQEFGETLNIGAGTVLTLADEKEAIKCGATFVLSPIMMTEEMFSYANEHDVVTVPGAWTPTEIVNSFQLGADIVKIFPAGALDQQYFKDIAAPLGKMDLMAVGGVNATNANAFIENGVEYLGIGSGIFQAETIKACDVEQLIIQRQQFERVLQEGTK